MESGEKRQGIAYRKSLTFARMIVRSYQNLVNAKHEYVLSKQLLRSGTSIGANLAEARCGYSPKDFLSKVYIALKECAETTYWLDLLYDCDYIETGEYQALKSDCEELRRMLSATTKTMQDSLHS